MTGLTLHTLTRWLTPWRTIRRLEDELNAANKLLGAFWRDAERTELSRIRLCYCPTHGQQPPNAWGCPECVRELRGELATAREALRRLVCYYAGQDYDSEVVRGVYLWATDNGMAGPLPPLPDHIAKRDQLTTEDQL
jgi:hypothetical protein